MELHQVFAVAMKELRDRLRNRWVVAVALVFAALALVIAYFGGAQQGAVGLRSIEFTIASLVSLVIYLIPLLGKYLGLAAALTLSTLVGFGLVAVLLVVQTGTAGLEPYLGFMFSSVLLGLAFLSLAVMLSVLASDRARASGLAIALWFFFVLVFDLLLLGLLVATGGETGGAWFPYLLLLNPADVFRILNVFSLDEVRNLYGLSSIVPSALAKPWLMGLVMLGWIVAPLGIATWRFRP
jgi:Cu-processing system permease protein